MLELVHEAIRRETEGLILSSGGGGRFGSPWSA
jgi:hypothetical protein